MKILVVLLLIISMMNSNAEVRTNILTSPIRLNPFNDDLKSLPIDFNQDGKVDIQLVYGQGGLSAYFPATNRVAVRISGNTIGSLPLNTVIGSHLPPELKAFRWDNGSIVPADVPELSRYGDRRRMIVSTLMAPRTPGQGVFTTAQSNNPALPSSPLGSGDVIGKNGVIAVEFQIDGNTHYGYLHVDFRPDAAINGVILGFAYETIPNAPITATPLDAAQTRH